MVFLLMALKGMGRLIQTLFGVVGGVLLFVIAAISAFILFKPLIALLPFGIFIIVFAVVKNKFNTVITPLYIILFMGIGYAGWMANTYHRIGIVLRSYPLAVAKACLHSHSRTDSLNLIQQELRYAASYVTSREYSQTVFTAPKHDRLLNFNITFFTYYDLQHLFYEIFVREIYAFKAQTSTPFIIDCGSNIGMSVVYFKFLYPQARIIGFEPGKSAFKVLIENVTRNKFSNVDVYNKACSNKDGIITFFTDNNNQGCTRMNMLEKTHGCITPDTIPGVKLSRFIDKPVDLIKIDVEGAEYMIVQELASSGKLALVKHMIIEYHHHLFNSNEDKLSSFLKILEDNNFGYQIAVDGGDHVQFGDAQYPMIYAYKK